MDPYKQLASMLDRRMEQKSTVQTAGLACELATVTPGGLKLDSFKHELQHYYVADWLVRLHLPEQTLDEVRIDLRAGLTPGDRVLVIPIQGGQEVVVVSKVVSSSA